MRLLYTLGIHLYGLGLRLAALFGHHSARLMLHGYRKPLPVPDGRPTAWFHAASLGEFEQARPVLEAYRRRHPDCRVVVSFFSPSGYEVRKGYAQADAVVYLPLDTPRRVRRLLDAVQPSVAFFVKYDFWFNTLGELRRRGVPTYIFSAIFRPQQYFFRWYGGWFRRQLQRCFSHIFVQNEESLNLLRTNGIEQCSLAGDTRFDRVHQIALEAERDAVVEAFLHIGEQPLQADTASPVLVCGSTWPPDEEILSQLRIKNEELRIIIAPHVISEEHLRQVEALFPDSIRYSALKANDYQLPTTNYQLPSAKILIIDNIGILSKLYRYATVAYIGGGFGVGIHNILEAVTFGKPVIFGPNYHKFQEAHDIIARGGGWSIGTEHDSHTTALADLEACLAPLLSDPMALAQASQACTEYMNANLGSTDKILNTIEK